MRHPVYTDLDLAYPSVRPFDFHTSYLGANPVLQIEIHRESSKGCGVTLPTHKLAAVNKNISGRMNSSPVNWGKTGENVSLFRQ